MTIFRCSAAVCAFAVACSPQSRQDDETLTILAGGTSYDLPGLIAADKANPNRTAVLRDIRVHAVVDEVPPFASSPVQDVIGFSILLRTHYGNVVRAYLPWFTLEDAAKLNQGQKIALSCDRVEIDDADVYRAVDLQGCALSVPEASSLVKGTR